MLSNYTSNLHDSCINIMQKVYFQNKANNHITMGKLKTEVELVSRSMANCIDFVHPASIFISYHTLEGKSNDMGTDPLLPTCSGTKSKQTLMSYLVSPSYQIVQTVYMTLVIT